MGTDQQIPYRNLQQSFGREEITFQTSTEPEWYSKQQAGIIRPYPHAASNIYGAFVLLKVTFNLLPAFSKCLPEHKHVHTLLWVRDMEEYTT